MAMTVSVVEDRWCQIQLRPSYQKTGLSKTDFKEPISIPVRLPDQVMLG
jgi:hypothetical protein